MHCWWECQLVQQLWRTVRRYLRNLYVEPKCPLADDWIRKKWYIYTMEYYSAIKKNDILPFATKWMDLEGVMLSEILYDTTSTWDLKNKTKECM